MDESVACHEPGPEHSASRDAVLLADSDSLDPLCRPGEEVTEERESEARRWPAVDPLGCVGVIGADESGPHLGEQLWVAEEVSPNHAFAMRDEHSGLSG